MKLRLNKAQIGAILSESGSGLIDGINYRFNQHGIFLGNSGSGYVKYSNKYTESSDSLSDMTMSCLLQKNREIGGSRQSQTMRVITSPSFTGKVRSDGHSNVQMQTYRELAHSRSALNRVITVADVDKSESDQSAQFV